MFLQSNHIRCDSGRTRKCTLLSLLGRIWISSSILDNPLQILKSKMYFLNFLSNVRRFPAILAYLKGCNLVQEKIPMAIKKYIKKLLLPDYLLNWLFYFLFLILQTLLLSSTSSLIWFYLVMLLYCHASCWTSTLSLAEVVATCGEERLPRVNNYFKDKHSICCISVTSWYLRACSFTLFSSDVRACTLYTCIFPESMTATICRSEGLTDTLLMRLSADPISNSSLHVLMLINLIIPSWLNTPRIWVKLTVTF